MDVKTIFEVLLNPKYMKLILILLAITLLVRNFYYLVSNQALALFGSGQQEVIDAITGFQVPMLLMTIIWPLIFAVFNSINDKIKLNRAIFLSVVLIHVITVIIAAWVVWEDTFYEDVFEKEAFLVTLIGAPTLSVLVAAASVWVYKKHSLFAS